MIVQSCNGDDSCSPWNDPNDPVEFTTAGPEPVVTNTPTAAPTTTAMPTTAPDPVVDLGVTAGISSLTVRWNPASTGSPPTHYEVEHRESGSSDAWSLTRVDAPTTVRIIQMLDDGTTYEVQVRACNSHGCSADEEGMGTPTEVPKPTLPPPTGLDVMPLPQRKASLSWTNVTNATDYVVQVQVVAESNWRVPNCNDADHGNVERPGSGTRPICELDLDDLTAGATNLGLAEHKAYRFQIKATDDSDNHRESNYSKAIIIIDTPITVANGRSTDRDEAELTWTAIDDGSILGSGFSSGDYELHYRQSTNNHTTVGWRPHMFTPRITPNPADKYKNITGTSKTIDSLMEYEIYAVQLIKRQTGPLSNVTVFAARDAYVWVTDRAAGIGTNSGERVAGFPLEQRLIGKTFRYTICEETFFPHDPLNPDKSRRNKWIAMIDHAAEAWETASRGLISVVNSYEACAPYHVIVRKIGERIAMARKDNPAVSDMDLSGHIMAAVHTLHAQGLIRSLHSSDPLRNEMLMWDNLDGPLGVAHRVGAFRQFADDIAYEPGCWWESDGTYKPGNMCNIDGDIIVRRDAYDSRDTSIFPSADDPLDTPERSARFNKCLNASDHMNNTAYISMLHEIGHALGIGGGDKEDSAGNEWSSPSHPKLDGDDSVMNYNFSEPDCSPHPSDVMSIYALYQKP